MSKISGGKKTEILCSNVSKIRKSAIKFFFLKMGSQITLHPLEKGLFPHQSLQWPTINMNCLSITHFRMDDDDDIRLILHPNLT